MRTIYYTEDGKKFSTKEAAELHEQELAAENKQNDELMEKIEANNKRMSDICTARENLLEQIDKLSDEFKKLRDENEKLLKEYMGEDKYNDLTDSFDKLISMIFG